MKALPQSHAVLRAAFKPKGCKRIAADLKLSLSIVHKWSRARRDGLSEEFNPLDRVATLYLITGDRQLIQWLCAQADGFFVPNVAAPPATKDSAGKLDLAKAEAVVLQEEAELMASLAGLLAEKELSREKVSRLRALWERCKADMERLVHSLERGEFRKQLTAWLLKFYPVCDALTPGGLI